jgi:hypothetical protein
VHLRARTVLAGRYRSVFTCCLVSGAAGASWILILPAFHIELVIQNGSKLRSRGPWSKVIIKVMVGDDGDGDGENALEPMRIAPRAKGVDAGRQSRNLVPMSTEVQCRNNLRT